MFWLDEVTVSDAAVEIERQLGLVPNPAIQVEGVEVTPVEDRPDQVDVAINPITCLNEEGDWPLFGIEGAEIDGLGFDGSGYSDSAALAAAKLAAETEYLRTRENVTFTSSAWGGGSVRVERMARGSHHLRGNYSLTFRGKTVENFPLTVTTEKETCIKIDRGIAIHQLIFIVHSVSWTKG